ncbi:O-antigen ligase family protein [Extensimonas vulgaris]|uniref:O-antigen ligase n=1 Tax=Extensimonas vulgaris TaxID=1031594 RepID=A0A369AU55_9BURK|nr:O-antigen ligase family protein [Extensimonas vulgaris]RCX10994.1 O-antigen ligase [Extensimonas vulgaris]TWI41668.1 O-antigen ligase [Extensimonas vulgaris]
MQQGVLNAAAFLVLAPALWLPSGYSIGAILLVMLGLWRWPAVLRGRLAPHAPLRAWALVVLAMGLVWSMYLFEGGRLITNTLGLDRSSKYFLVLLALPAVWAQRPAAWALRWGCWVGAAGAGVLAGWQVLVQHLVRAEGYTNAIQFGNLSLLLALWSGIWAVQASCPYERLLGALAAVLGIAASVLSGSRGGWVVLPVLLVLFVWFARPQTQGSQGSHGRRGLLALGAALLTCLLLAALPPVQQRAHEAAQELLQQPEPEKSNTATGSRLAFWMHAWRLGLEHPWLGAGQLGYEQSQREAVARQEMPSMSVHFNHAHNEWLDMFAKRGLLGVIGLALFYAVPGLLCWRCLRRGGREPLENAAAAGNEDAARSECHAAALCGLVTVLGYLGFGMTQVMFAHNNGNLMYLLPMSLWLAVCWPGAGAPAAFRAPIPR